MTAENKIVIQAKPLHFKTVEEDLRDIELAERKNGSADDFFESVRKEAFSQDDESVLMIDPGLDVDQIFGDVELPCNLNRRLNNTLYAPILPNLEETGVKPKVQFNEP